MNAHNANLILCPQPGCNMLYERISGCENLTCGNPNSPYGKVNVVFGHSLGAIGCGFQLHAINHRVPAPTPGQPALALFAPDRVRLDINQLPSTLPKLPLLPTPSGHYAVNYVAMARYIFATTVRGRARIVIDQDLFEPLPRAAVQVGDGGNVKLTFHSQRKGLETRWKENVRQAMQATSSSNEPSNDSSNVYIRLRIVADYLSKSTPKSAIRVEDEITAEQKERLRKFACRQSEGTLQSYCEQLYSLSVGIAVAVANITNEDMESELGAFYSSTCDAMLAAITSVQWSDALCREIGPYKITAVPAMAHIFAGVGIEGEYLTVPQTVNETLPPNDKARLEALLTEVLSEALDDEGRREALLELQGLGSALVEQEQVLLLSKATLMLRQLPRLAAFVRDKDGLSSRLLGGVTVSRYGAVMRSVRRFIGAITQHLLRDQLSLPLAHMTRRKGEDLYVERVSDYWLQMEGGKEGDSEEGESEEKRGSFHSFLQQQGKESSGEEEEEEDEEEEEEEGGAGRIRLGDARDRGLLSAAQDRAVQRLKQQEEGEEWEIVEATPLVSEGAAGPVATGSDHEHEREGRVEFDLSSLPLVADAVHVVAPPPAPLDDPTPASPAPQPSLSPDPLPALDGHALAWSLLTAWRERVGEQVDALGLCVEGDLAYMEEEDVLSLAALLPKVPARELCRAMGCACPGWDGQGRALANASGAVELLSGPSAPEGQRALLEGWGVQLAGARPLCDQLALLDGADWESLIAFLKPVPQRKLRFFFFGALH